MLAGQNMRIAIDRDNFTFKFQGNWVMELQMVTNKMM